MSHISVDRYSGPSPLWSSVKYCIFLTQLCLLSTTGSKGLPRGIQAEDFATTTEISGVSKQGASILFTWKKFPNLGKKTTIWGSSLVFHLSWEKKQQGSKNKRGHYTTRERGKLCLFKPIKSGGNWSAATRQTYPRGMVQPSKFMLSCSLAENDDLIKWLLCHKSNLSEHCCSWSFDK